MRLFKRALLSMGLMLFAIVALNALRIASTPAQGNPPGEGQASIRNGDVNCDGLLDITDPILVLNWLFGDGPEPCANAQADPPCCQDLREELASLRSGIEAVTRRLPDPADVLLLTGRLNFPAQGAELAAYKVPDDKWFIFTLAEVGLNWMQLKMRVDGVLTKIPLGTNPNDAVRRATWPSGIALPPGSELILSYPQTMSDPPSPFVCDFYINGYLVAQ